MQKKSFIVATFVILILQTAFTTAFSAPFTDTQIQTIEQIIEKSGFKEQAAMIPGLFQDTNAKSQEETETSQQIDAIFQAGFAVENIVEEVKQTFLKQYDEKHAREVLKFYDSKLGKKIAQAEIESAALSFAGKMEGFDFENYDKKRRQVITRLFDDLKTLELQSKLQSIVLEMVFRSANAVMPKESRMSDAAVTGMWEKMKEQFDFEDSGDSQRANLLNMFYLVYENITTAELEKYHKFIKSKPGKWFIDCSHNGLVNALKKSATQVITDLMDHTDEYPRIENEEPGEDTNIHDLGDI